MKVNKREQNILENNGWVKIIFSDIENIYDKNIDGETWCLAKDRDYINEIIEKYEMGSRICLMTDIDRNAKWLLQNVSCDGYWLCDSLEEALYFIEEETNW